MTLTVGADIALLLLAVVIAIVVLTALATHVIDESHHRDK